MWRKSSRSEAASQCVEVRNNLTAIRDSKIPNGPALTVDLSRLLTAVKSGKLDH